MTCHNCLIEMVKAGKYGKNMIQRFKCKQCGKRFSEPQQKPFGADVRIPTSKVEMILHCMTTLKHHYRRSRRSPRSDSPL